MLIFNNFLKKIKHSLWQFVNVVIRLSAGPMSPVLAPIISYMARTGTGTNSCLRWNCLPMPVNFYSPVPDLTDLETRHIWDQRSDLTGIDFCPDVQVHFLKELGQTFGHECEWPLNPTENPHQFYTENNSFSYGCAASTHCILRQFNPHHVIEIGSGHSSQVIASALLMNRNRPEKKKEPEYIIIDPYPRQFIEQGLPGVPQLVKQRVELLDDKRIFEQLGKNDVLFIDSSHTVRIGSDVNYLILDILPRLAPGVIVHFHDIGLPYEYSKVYAMNPAFRMFWTEAYLLQAFLCLNRQFEILLAMSYLMTDQQEEFLTAFPHYDPAKHQAISGSFWIRR